MEEIYLWSILIVECHGTKRKDTGTYCLVHRTSKWPPHPGHKIHCLPVLEIKTNIQNTFVKEKKNLKLEINPRYAWVKTPNRQRKLRNQYPSTIFYFKNFEMKWLSLYWFTRLNINLIDNSASHVCIFVFQYTWLTFL